MLKDVGIKVIHGRIVHSPNDQGRGFNSGQHGLRIAGAKCACVSPKLLAESLAAVHVVSHIDHPRRRNMVADKVVLEQPLPVGARLVNFLDRLSCCGAGRAQRVGAWRPGKAGRIDQHKPRDFISVVGCVSECDNAAARRVDQSECLEIQMADQPLKQIDIPLDRVEFPPVRIRQTGIGEIETDNAETLAQVSREKIPGSKAVIKGVQKNDRLALTLIDVMKVDIVQVDVLRRAEPVFFLSSSRGTLDSSAETGPRAKIAPARHISASRIIGDVNVTPCRPFCR